MHADDVMNMLKSTPGLSDRQITDALFGPGKPQQTVNQVCRNLRRRGLIIRQNGANGVVGNFIADGSCVDSPVETTKKGETIAASVIPLELRQKMQELGRLWAESSERLRLSSEMKKHWDALIEAWVADLEVPLAVRKMGSGVRGGVVIHGGSGRELVLSGQLSCTVGVQLRSPGLPVFYRGYQEPNQERQNSLYLCDEAGGKIRSEI